MRLPSNLGLLAAGLTTLSIIPVWEAYGRGNRSQAVAVLLFQIGAGLPIVVAALPLELAFRGPRLG